MSYINEIENFVKKLSEKSSNIHKKYHNLPKGSLAIYKDGKYIRFVQVYTEGGRTVHKGISKNLDLIHKLAYKSYMKIKIERLDHDIKILSLASSNLEGIEDGDIKRLLPNNYHILDDSFFMQANPKQLSPDFTGKVKTKTIEDLCNVDVSRFQREPYHANSKEMQNLKILTSQGFYVRSKSEASIVDIYVKYGIPFHYDEVIDFGDVFISPDFVSIRDDGTPIFHEHCGMMDNNIYLQNYDRKMSIYRNHGIVPWENLIITYDNPDGGINLTLVEEEIRAKLIDYGSSSLGLLTVDNISTEPYNNRTN